MLVAAQPGMAVPQRPNPTASGTGNPACAPLSGFSVIDSRGTAYNCQAFLRAESCLWQHSQEWLCHKDRIRQPVAQAILPVRLCLASVLSILGEQLTIAKLSSVLSHACGSTARNGCATKTESDSQWHRQSCLCAFVWLQCYRF